MRSKLWLIVLCAVTVAMAGCGSSSRTPNSITTFPPANVPLTRLSTDLFTSTSGGSQHATEVEPGSYAFGQTIVTSFQVGRIPGGGSADIGYAISNDGGATWQNGTLPGLTTFQGGTSSAVSDTTPIFDNKHGVWMISSLPIGATIQVAVSRSTDGGMTWANPVFVASGADLDKDWITCDNTAASPFFGNCYLEWDDNGNGNLVWMSTSTDGGLTWSVPVNAVNPGIGQIPAHGLAAEQLVQPNGTVVVPFWSDFNGAIEAFSSTDGGTTWTNLVPIAPVNAAPAAGGLRDGPLPSAAMDNAGNIYVVWQDCSFRASCGSNDLVMSTSADGVTWSLPARIPIDPVTSGADHFIPGLGVDPTTSGSTAHLGLTYYYYPQANCTAATCALFVGFISSLDGGVTWSSPTPIAGPMSLSWLPATSQGRMVGDYIATSFSGPAGGPLKAYGFFAVAKQNSGTTFDQAIYTTQSGFDVSAAVGHFSSAGEQPQAQPHATSNSSSPARRMR